MLRIAHMKGNIMKFCNYDCRDTGGFRTPFASRAAQDWKAKQEHNAKCLKTLKKASKKSKKKQLSTLQSEW